MISEQKLEKHFFTTATTVTKELCQPLFDTDAFHDINFMRIYNDGAHISLNSSEKFNRAFYKEGYKYSVLIAKRTDLPICPDSEKPFVWEDTVPDHPLIKMHHETEGIQFGITLPDISLEHIDYYSFGSRNAYSTQQCLNRMPLLKRFVSYFKDQAKDLLADAQKSRISLPNHYHSSAPHLFSYIEQLSDFSDVFPNKKTYIAILKSKLNLSLRETQTLWLMIRGYSCPRIGKELNISARTIESYVINMKNKLECYSKAEVVTIGLNILLKSK